MEETSMDWALLVAALAAGETIVQLALMERQRRALGRGRDKVPMAFTAHLTLEQHQRAADYGRDRLRFAQARLLSSRAFFAWLLFGGVLAEWDSLLFDLAPGRVLQPMAFLGLVGLAQTAWGLPWSWYHHFRLEERHGFNRMTTTTFFADLVKGLVLGGFLGALLLWPLLELMRALPLLWVVPAWGVWTFFQLLMVWLWPRAIAPLFNKFTPLQDEALDQGIRRLVEAAGFHAGGVMVMDASRRSGHGNAFFTGVGRHKRIVFFDTLLEKLSSSQVLAVLAHEVGHLRHGHVRKALLWSLVTSALGFLALGWLRTRPDIFQSLGLSPTPGPLLLLAGWVAPMVLFPLAPLLSWRSRLHEFQADRWAVEHSSARDLGDALLALHRDNASSVVHDPLYARFHYSHPPLEERLAGMGHGVKPG